MKRLDPNMTVNLARGLASLVDQAMVRIAVQKPALTKMCLGLGDVLKQGIAESAIPKEDLSALDLARRVGLVVEPAPAKRKRRRG